MRMTAYEIFEKLAFVGIHVNLVEYLGRMFHQGTVTSSNNVTSWTGTMSMMTILGAYVADAYLGRYWTFVISATTYLLGMVLLTLAVSVPALKPPACKNHGVKEENCPKSLIFPSGYLLFGFVHNCSPKWRNQTEYPDHRC
ncbi:Proton-dependent oligopeptide transporter family [Trema orientale]|uniref:Proton-dependent oligopeptide transporter family n=1 Tax=Trema orientale TaxID=63057 RepID=A0A2P5D0I3_TREOI|nr:Proton-dependent oligopeptide transporter family [Trema orientale]